VEDGGRTDLEEAADFFAGALVASALSVLLVLLGCLLF
jgi:hypothetical protein